MDFRDGTWLNDTPSGSLRLYFLFGDGGRQEWFSVFLFPFSWTHVSPDNEPAKLNTELPGRKPPIQHTRNIAGVISSIHECSMRIPLVRANHHNALLLLFPLFPCLSPTDAHTAWCRSNDRYVWPLSARCSTLTMQAVKVTACYMRQSGFSKHFKSSWMESAAGSRFPSQKSDLKGFRKNINFTHCFSICGECARTDESQTRAIWWNSAPCLTWEWFAGSCAYLKQMSNVIFVCVVMCESLTACIPAHAWPMFTHVYAKVATYSWMWAPCVSISLTTVVSL